MRAPLLVGLLCASAADAECISSTIGLDGERSLPTNGLIVVSAIGKGAALLDEVAKHKPELVSDKERVALVLVTTNSSKAETQVVLKPERLLKPKTKYRLVFQDVDSEISWSESSAVFTTNRGPDLNAPAWTAEPAVSAPQARRLGCGPEYGATITVPVKDGSSLWVRVETGQRTVWAFVTDGHFEFKHFMCGGPYGVRPDTRYELTLTAIDAAGNEAPDRKHVVVAIPTQEDIDKLIIDALDHP
jgi:hypothetical protein